ncbi:MAG TPA: hypothetical protein PLC51_03245 [Candidatus Marinimicrobia bacterium]|jgi:hypothetical protein|nr:hypothetical protein [Candidatus Neomarinimicrobiota bacterium]
MRKIILILGGTICVVLVGLGLIGCEGDEANQPSYILDIDPIFGSAKYNCKGCHTGATSPYLDLTTYEGLMAGSDNGKVVIPGDADHSFLYEKISQPIPSRGERMPLGGPFYLTSGEIRLIEDWINLGAKNN